MSDAHDVEEGLIGAVLRDGSKYAEAREIVKPGQIHNWNYSQIWQACENLHQNGLGIDTITVGDEIERMGVSLQEGPWSGRAVLGWIRDSGDPKNVLSYAENVQDKFYKRFLDTLLTKGVVHAKNGRRSKDIMADLMVEFGKIELYSQQDEYTVPIEDAITKAYEMSDRASRGEIIGIPTGFIDLDRMLGSLYAGNVYIVAGRPGTGKTAILGNISMSAARRGKKVAIFSLEMSREQVAQRMASQMTEINLLEGIIKGHMSEAEWVKYVAAVETISALPIIINDLSAININQIRQTARKIKPDLVIVDYIQLAGSDEKRTERRELEVSAVSRGLKYLARELNVPVLAAAQLSRAVEQRKDQRPILSDLRESGSLEQDAYSVMFLYQAVPNSGLVEVIIAKHRNGPTGTIDLTFKGQYAKFENAAFACQDLA